MGNTLFPGDPDPIDDQVRNRQTELYLFSRSDTSPRDRTTVAPGFEIDDGFARRLTARLTIPYNWYTPTMGPQGIGLGDIAAALGYEIVTESATRPQVGIFPAVTFATGSLESGGNGRTWYSVPLYVEKSWSRWTIYATGGVALNSAPGQLNYGFAGALLRRNLSDRVALAASVWSQGATVAGGDHAEFYGIDATIKPNNAFSLSISLGHTFAGESHATAYVGISRTFGP